MEGAPTKVQCRASLIGHLRLDVISFSAFLCKLGLLFFKPRWNYQISRWNHKMWVWKDNANDSGHSRKMTASCKWPISFFFRRSWSEYWEEFWEYGRGKAAKIRNRSLVNVNCSGWAQVFHSVVKAPLLVLALGSKADPGFFVGGGALLRNGVIDWWRKQILIANTKKKAFD